VLITGTNGKTTTAAMIAAMLRRAGHRVIHNATGANLTYGIASTYLQDCDAWGRPRGDIAVLEVDEAAMPGAVRQLPVRAVVVTNFFRDQLDRFGELDHAVAKVGQGLSLLDGRGRTLLNADDPLAAGLADMAGSAIYYGLEIEADGLERHPVRELRYCTRCEVPLAYASISYGHLGHWVCQECGRGRPTAEVSGLVSVPGSMDEDAMLTVRTPRGVRQLRLPLPGVYNVYNALAAVACADVLDLPWTAVEESLRSFTASFGRMERLAFDGRDLLLVLVKNPAGFNEVIRTLLAQGDVRDLLIAVNNRYADGTDVSWLWDVDFERLVAAGGSLRVTVTGTRAEAMAVRLKYAGLDEAELAVHPELGEALARALTRTPPGGRLYILPTYTAMLGIRETLRRHGRVGHYWER
jgi:UDP-N-acetylmuramyl tripeptide synthase